MDTQESWGLAERELAKRPAEDAEALKSRRTRDRRLHAGMAQWRVEASAIADPHEAGGARWRPSGACSRAHWSCFPVPFMPKLIKAGPRGKLQSFAVCSVVVRTYREL